jgi:hypothetical protein
MNTNQELQNEMLLFDLARTIEYAQVRCLTKPELIEELSKYQPGDFLDPYLVRLSELELNEIEINELVAAIDSILNDYENYSAKDKGKVESFVARLLDHLPDEHTAKYFDRFINSTRQSGRKIAYRSCINRALSFAESTKLLSAYNMKGELGALKVIITNSQYLSLKQIKNIMGSVEDKYWKARLIEMALKNEIGTSLDFRDEFPFELTHAIGRLSNAKYEDDLRYMFEANKEDIEFLSIYAYALGKICDKTSLKILEKHVKRQFPHNMEIHATSA